MATPYKNSQLSQYSFLSWKCLTHCLKPISYSNHRKIFIDQMKSKPKFVPNPSLVYSKNHYQTKHSLSIASGSSNPYKLKVEKNC